MAQEAGNNITMDPRPRWPSLKPFNIGGDADPYLQRWFILPRNKWFCIYLHRMLRDDDDRALHDHPGSNISIVLRGGYVEHIFVNEPTDGRMLPQTRQVFRRPGRIVFRRARLAHRLVLPNSDPSWSLFIMFPKRREWGFWATQNGRARWMPWWSFLAAYGDAKPREGMMS